VKAGLATDELLASIGPWLRRQRWFAGKAREVASVALRDVVRLDRELLDLVVDVAYADGGTEQYQVPLLVDGPAFSDALSDAGACRVLASLCLRAEHRPTSDEGELIGNPVAPAAVPDGPVRMLGVEQSNSSVVFGERMILKLFRKLEPGTNPDVELTRALTEAGFAHVPAQRGSVDLVAGDQPPRTLAVLSDFLDNAQEGWALATTDPDRLLADLDELGSAVGRMHAILEDRFASRAATPRDVASWGQGMLSQLDAVLATAAARDPDRTAQILDRANDIRVRLRAGLEVRDPGIIQRIHGDLHLGQVLLDPELGWQLLDFEGEPARSLAERREPSSPLRDVAGMLRSFEYAAAGPWVDLARDRFIGGYRPVAAEARVLPDDPASESALLAAFELDKAIYELGYELANRPTWVDVPVRGILRLLDG
jgi:maltokinase